jgi:hypothetical protein
MIAPGFVAAADSIPQRRALLENRLASDPNNTAVLFELGKLLHDEAALDKTHPKDLTHGAEKCLSRLLALCPTNAYARAMLGSAIIMTAHEGFLPTTKIKTVRKGLEEIDAAVAAAPNDPFVRFTRACNNTFLPEFFHRREIVMTDYKWLMAQISDHGSAFEPEMCQYVHLYYGICCKRGGDKASAKTLWEDGLRMNPQTKIAERIRKELGATRDEPKGAAGAAPESPDRRAN